MRFVRFPWRWLSLCLVALIASCAASKPPPGPAPSASATAPAGCEASADPPFDRKIALEELTKATDEVAGCAGPTGPQGVGKIAVVFICDGRAVSAELDIGGPDGFDPGVDHIIHGTPAERCVQTSFLKIHLPHFGGSNVMVHKTFRLTPPSPATAK